MIEESSYNRIQEIEGISIVVKDGMGQKRVLKNTLFKEDSTTLTIPAPSSDVSSSRPLNYSSSGLFGSSKVDRLKQIYDRKRVH